MNITKAYAVDKRAESEGRRLVLVPGKTPDDEGYLLIARKGNVNHKAYLSKVLQENSAMLSSGTPEAETLAQSIFRDAAARHLLIGWGGPLTVDVAAPTPEDPKAVREEPIGAYSVERARTMLDMDDFYQLVDKFSDTMGNYKPAEVAKDAKNLVTT